jgi:hypothetical protein
MDTLEKHIISIIIVKPRFVHGALFGISVSQNTHISVFSENDFVLHALYNFLCAITMMNIEVHNCHFFDFLSISAFQICRSDGDIVDVAKAVGLLFVAFIVFKSASKHTSMMAWRSDCAERVFVFSCHNSVDTFNDRSSRQKSRHPTIRRHPGVLVVIHRSHLLLFLQKLAFVHNLVDISVIMHFQDICHFGGFYRFFQII